LNNNKKNKKKQIDIQNNKEHHIQYNNY